MPTGTPTGYTQRESGLFVPQEMQATAISDLRHPAAWLETTLGAGRVSSNIFVSPQSSLALSTYYACLRAISEDCAKLPLQVFERLDRGRRKATEHWLWPILHDQFNEDMTAFTAREVMAHHALGWGNAYGLILRDRSMTRRDGEVIGVYPLHPSRVTIRRDPKTQRLLYEVRMGQLQRDGQPQTDVVDMADMLHIHGPSPDGICGYSVAQIAAESLGLSLAAQTYGASFFGNSGRPGGILSHPGRLTDVARVNLRESWDQTHGGVGNAGKTAVLEEGITWIPITIPPEQAQFLDTRNFQVREICRWFRMPPHKVADLSEAKWANVEAENISYVVDTLTPWLVRWEQEIQVKLLGIGSDYYAKHAVNSLLRGDMAARQEFYRSMVSHGIYAPNDALELEDMNPYEGGDEHFMQVNMAPVRKIVDGTARPQRTAGRPASPPLPAASHNGHGAHTYAP